MNELTVFVAYSVFCILAAYILSVSLLQNVVYFLPRFSVWREEVTGSALLLGTFIALIPVVNVLFVIVSFFIG